MKTLINGLYAFIALLLVTSCDNTHTHSEGNPKIDANKPAVVKILLDEKGIPKPSPETVDVIPGQEMIFIAQEKFEIIFLGRSPTEPRSRRIFNDYQSNDGPGEGYQVKITVSEKYKGLPVMEDLPEITLEQIEELAKELGVEFINGNHDAKMKKTPIDTDKSLYIHYLIKIGDVLYDPGARIIKS